MKLGSALFNFQIGFCFMITFFFYQVAFQPSVYTQEDLWHLILIAYLDKQMQ